ncbi:MAG: outer membrane lipid asymmetry maintenance protein MlaD [Gammaproteobacteria bacterium]|nr:MAG: outer membrane lipid asymmetry maintenance protein MlaD [Gammaproteobacteria bacterium]RLA14470.1 MAG: outer membrane lipid asymmetry maintenance protein MlaD [Gammaproteobacteria bacterium]
MNNSRALELVVGLFMVLGFAALLFLSLKGSNLAEYQEGDSYTVIANFSNIGGLRVRASVTVAGVRVGRIASIEFDKDSYMARVAMAIVSEYDQFSLDTTASIRTSGLIGEQYVALEPGGDPDNLTEGSEIELTQSALVMERLIGQFLYGKASGDK